MKRISFLIIAITAFALNALAGTGGGGGSQYWFSFKATMTASPTGAGKVYGSFTSAAEAATATTEGVATRHRNSESNNKDIYAKNDINLYLKAYPEPGYEFVEWQNQKGERVANLNKEEGTAMVKSFKSTNSCGVNNSNNKCDNSTSNAVKTDSTYVAIFRKIETTAVSVNVEGNEYCKAECLPQENHNGDEVTIWAYNGNATPQQLGYQKKFLGWRHNGEIVSRESSITFTVNDENKGEYVAVFDNGYQFGRLKNVKTGHYLTISSDPNSKTPSIQDITNVLTLNESNEALFDPGTIIRISSTKNIDNSGRNVFHFGTQNTATTVYYQLPSIYIRLNLDNKNNAWYLSTHQDEGGTMLGENDDETAYLTNITSVNNDNRCSWKFEVLDKDLTATPECYFTIDPNNCVKGADNMYYTTMRTEFNYKYNRDKITAYLVSGLNEDGTLELTEIDSNIIPGKTCVLLKLKSTDTQENVLIPTLTASSFSTAGKTNLLVSTPTDGSYFANQKTTEQNMKGLKLFENGEIGFGGEALTTIDGNRCYLQIPNDYVIDITAETTLEEVVDKQTVDKKYKITDLTCVYTFMKDGKAMFFCKDDNGYEDKDEISNGQIDFLKEKTQLMNENNRTDHDQSNWIILEAPASMQITNGEMNNLLSQRLAGVEGKLVDVVNPKLSLSKVPQPYEMNGYTLNTFIPSNFYGYSAEDKYYFVTPKPNEMASIHWAMYNGDNHFSAPTNVGTSNPEGLQGEFEVDFSLFNEEMPELIENNVYSFNGLVTKLAPNSSAASHAPGVIANYYLVYPISNFKWEGSVVDGIVTGINDVNAGRKVMSVKYVNITGNMSTKPFDGLNIMVTTYSDGTMATRKFMK